MEPSGRASGGLNAAAEGENCLKEIANNYVEEEDGDISSGEETGVGRENGIAFPVRVGEGVGGRHVLVGNGSGECRDGADDSGGDGGRMEVSSDGSGEEHSGESSEDDEGDGEEVEVEVEVEEEEQEEEDEEVREEEMRRPNHGTSGGRSRGMDGTENGFAKEQNREGYSGDAEEGVGDAGGVENGVGAGEKSQSESEGDPESGGTQGGRTLRRRKGRPLKSGGQKASVRASPITPKLEEPRAVRVNRGMKRRFPGDESEDSLPKRVRVRSIASVCGDVSQSVKGEDLSMDESLEVTPAKRRGRPRKSDGSQGVARSDEAEASPPAGTAKRKMVEAVLDADSSKRPCHGKNGTVFACNAEGCKKRFAEAAALYAHARVHGDRPYVCHYDGCIKSFSERSKLKRHFLIHTGEKPFLCLYEGCGKVMVILVCCGRVEFWRRGRESPGGRRRTVSIRSVRPGAGGARLERCGMKAPRSRVVAQWIRDWNGETKQQGEHMRILTVGWDWWRDGVQAFSLDFNLRSHMKTHTGEYNECPYEGCDKRYCQEYKLRAHIAKEHSKPVKGTKKLAKVVGNDVRGTSGSRARDAAAAKKREMLSALMTKRSKLESMKEGRVSRMKELEEERQREASEVARIEQDLRRLERAQRQLEEGHAGSPGVCLSEEEDADDEEEEEEEGEEPSPSHGTAGDTSSSGEQQSRLEYTAMGEGKDVIMFAHKLPTADQGARLVRTMEARAPDSQQEPTTSLTPLLWLQGPPPHHGHLAQHSASRPFLRSRRPGGPEVARPTRALMPCSSLEEKERTPGESSDSGLGKANGVGKSGGGWVEGAGKARANGAKRNPGTGGRGGGKANASTAAKEKDGENGKVEEKAQRREKENQARAGKQQGGRPSSSEPVFVNPILLSSDHRFSPTDARFLSNQEFPSMAQAMLRDRLSKEAVKSAPGQAAVPREKVYRSMNEVLHSSASEQQGYSACSGLNEGFGGDQGPSEQSFEPSAAQLFTYHEQSRLVD